MLTRLEIDGFRSIERLELEMQPLTILIGPNGGGKTNILDAIHLLSSASKGQLADAFAARGGYETTRFRGGGSGAMHFELVFAPEGVFDGKGSGVHFSLLLDRAGNGFRITHEVASIRVKENQYRTQAFREANECHFYDHSSGEFEAPKIAESETELAIVQIRDQKSHPVPYQLAKEIASWRVYSAPATERDAPMRRPQILRSGLRVAPDGRCDQPDAHT